MINAHSHLVDGKKILGEGSYRLLVYVTSAIRNETMGI